MQSWRLVPTSRALIGPCLPASGLRRLIGRLLGRALVPLISLLLPACAHRAPAPASQATPGERPLVLTTAAPVTLFTRAVAGECATVVSLLPPGVDPHTFQSRPADLLQLRRARVLVSNGLGLEAFLAPLVTAAGHADLVRIDSARGLELASDPANPHAWLNPASARRQVQTIAEGLAAADPGCAKGYRQRAARYGAQLQALDRLLATRLAPYRGRSFVTSHAFAEHYAHRYGLVAQALQTNPEQEPTPADLQRVALVVRQGRLRAVLNPPGEPSRALGALARDLGVGVGSFDTLELLSDAQSRDPQTYGELLKRNTDQVIQSLGPTQGGAKSP